MLFKHPVRWATIRVVQNHLLHAWNPDKYFPNKSHRKQAAQSITILSTTTGNAQDIEDAKKYYLHLCAHQNLLLTYMEEGDPFRICVVNSALNAIADHVWPPKNKKEWTLCAENTDLLNLVIPQIHASIAYALTLAKRKYGGFEINEEIISSYEPKTTIMKIDNHNIIHKLSDFYGDGLMRIIKNDIDEREK